MSVILLFVLWIGSFIGGGLAGWFLPLFWWGSVLNLAVFIVLLWGYKRGKLAIADHEFYYDFLYLFASLLLMFGYWISFLVHWCVYHLQIV